MIEEVGKQNRLLRIQTKVDMAEAFNIAYVGSHAGRQNQSSYDRWKRRMEREAAKLRDEDLWTVWDVPRRKSRRLGR